MALSNLWSVDGGRRAVRSAPLVVLALAIALAPARADAQLGIDIGAQAPAAAVQTLDGKPANLSQFIGKGPVVMEFWATWCPNCEALEPELKRLHAKYGKRVTFVGVAVSVNQRPALVQRYVQRHKLPWVQLFDAKGEATGAYDVPATSYVVILDRSGKVVYTGVGGDQKLEAVIARVARDPG